MTVATHDLSCEVGAPLEARRWAAECLRASLGDGSAVARLIDDVVLGTSELVTNAVRAGCSALTVRLLVRDDAVRLSVIDDAPGRPPPRVVGPEALAGRGLRLLTALTRQWGVDPAQPGKEVWAEFARTE
jgi:anti-sigma regulatory factor (Ser/Thr protein kinase)